MSILEADDLCGERLVVDSLDANPAAHAQFANRTDDLDQKALDRLYPSEHLHVVDGVDGCNQRSHSRGCPILRELPTWFPRQMSSSASANHKVTQR